MKDIIDEYLLKQTEDTDEHTRYDGFTCGNCVHCPDGFEERFNWADSGFRSVYIDNDKRAVFTYCEGDLVLKVFKTQFDYDKHIVESAEFYKTH